MSDYVKWLGGDEGAGVQEALGAHAKSAMSGMFPSDNEV